MDFEAHFFSLSSSRPSSKEQGQGPHKFAFITHSPSSSLSFLLFNPPFQYRLSFFSSTFRCSHSCLVPFTSFLFFSHSFLSSKTNNHSLSFLTSLHLPSFLSCCLHPPLKVIAYLVLHPDSSLSLGGLSPFICLLDPLCLLPYLSFPSFYSFILAAVANAINPPFSLMML